MSSYEDNLDPGYLHVKIKIGDARGMRDDAPDHVDELRQQWARELPDLDTSPMTTLGRVYRKLGIGSRAELGARMAELQM